jgi:(R)-2-hydroxyacyl-CoA dehydratese activating ATPase
MSFLAGIDIGSTTIKVVIIDHNQDIIDHSVNPTGSYFHKHAMAAFESLLEKNNISRAQVESIYATGYGRKLFKEADDVISEISANAAGARKIGERIGKVQTVINIGGQDLKVIRLDEDGHVQNFVMNDKCAAGTGRFLEMTARNLEMEVTELGELHGKAKDTPLTINSTCTVFAESEIISLLANGNGKAELIAGIHYSIARRVTRLAKRLGIEGVVFFDGGPAMNQGLVEALENELMEDLLVPESPQMTTAYGAALIALDAWQYNENRG